MERLELALLRPLFRRLQLRLAFRALTPTPAQPALHSIELDNRELYLKYMEEVLSNKQQELIETEEYLTAAANEQHSLNGQRKIATPLALNHHAELAAKKIAACRELLKSLPGQTPRMVQFQQSLQLAEENCRKTQVKLREEMEMEWEELRLERRELAGKLSKLTELESYEKYLNQLQGALEQKEYEIIQLQRQLSGSLMAVRSQNPTPSQTMTEQFNTYNEDEDKGRSITLSDQSVRKRTKIFAKPKDKEVAPEPSHHRESSKIMQQNSTTNDYQFKLSKDREKEQLQMIESVGKPDTTQQAIQTQYPTKQQAMERLRGEELLLKYLGKWFGYSFKYTKATVTTPHRKAMALQLFRLKALFAPELRQRSVENLNWLGRIEPLGQAGYFNYGELSLRKKKYVELFFACEQRRFYRKKVSCALSNILRSRNRRERTAAVLMFRKFKTNAKLSSIMGQLPIPLQEKNSNLESSKVKQGGSRVQQNDSRVIQVTNSHPEVKMEHQRSKSKLGREASKGASTSTASQGNSKARLMKEKQRERELQINQANQVDLIKLKEYIRSQEEAEARLAIECAQTQSVFRLASTLNNSVNRIRLNFIVNSMRVGETAKISALERSLSSCEFKWELFMAKARLGLTNNSNKIAHLEQLVGFIGEK